MYCRILAGAPDFEFVGRRFESCRAHQKNDLINLTIMVIIKTIKAFLIRSKFICETRRENSIRERLQTNRPLD